MTQADSINTFKIQITVLLSTLLFLVILQPPIQISNYKLFLSDLWIFLILLFIFLKAPTGWLTQSLNKCLTISGVLLFIVFIHGSTRPSLINEFALQSLIIKEDDGFNFLKEAYNAFRFFSWFSLMAIFAAHPDWMLLKKIRTISYWLFILIIISLVAYTASESARVFYGNIYQYNPNYFDWKGRAHGVFSSPVEAGIATLLLGLLLISTEKNKMKLYLLSALTFVSILLTRSGTAGISIVLSISAIMLIKSKNISRNKMVLWFVGLSIVFVLIIIKFDYIWNNYPVLRGKILNLLYRIKPWSVYLAASIKRIDLFFLGYGFVPYHADNSFLFLLNRGGLFLLIGMIWALIGFLKKNIKRQNSWQLHIIIFLIISCFTVDLLIYRHTVAILIAFGIPFLSSNHNDA